MTEPNSLSERLARIEGSLAHIVRAVDASAGMGERLASIEARVAHIEKMIPQVNRSAIHDAKTDGWHSAKEDSEVDGRGRFALLVSGSALVVSIVSAMFGRGTP